MDLGRIEGRSPRVIRDQAREAAVLVPVVERADELWLLFTKRADSLGEHAGQMSFPGGGREQFDADRQQTALREANEEIGLDPTAVQVVGCLDDIRTVTQYAVTPYVSLIPDQPYTPDEREVAEIVVLPVRALCRPDNFETARREHPYYGELDIPYFHVDGYTVWGATGRIVVQFLELVTDWSPPEPTGRVTDVPTNDANTDVRQ